MTNFRLVGVILSCFVLFLQLFVITTNHWYYITNPSVNVGLWRICSSDVSQYALCSYNLLYPEFLDVIKAFLVLSVICNCFAVFSGVSSFLCKAIRTALSSVICSFLSGIFAIIGMGIFTAIFPKFVDEMLLGTEMLKYLPYGGPSTFSKQRSHSFSWAFFLSWFIIPALYVAGSLNVFTYRTEKEQELNSQDLETRLTMDDHARSGIFPQAHQQ